MTTLTILSKRVGPIRGHHPWVFSGAIKHIPEGLASGEPVELFDEAGKFLAAGYFNSYSQIAVRLWGFEQNVLIDQDFFVTKLRHALDLRTRFVETKTTNAYRLVYGENDGLPGLIVDRYSDYLVVQFHNVGIARWKKELVAALVEVLSPAGIYERSDVGGRTKHERADEAGAVTGLLYGEVPDRIIILENNIQFAVDVKTGQKTGFFLDQRDKRLALQKYVAGKKVLNCFSCAECA
jgi:23S rRNA (cytosine1962-C5)-methyltransferase